ncbi:MAG TPA: hypothetical protein VKB95_02360, partial [Chitinophagaceae bacterium]|nr:hypothetical protein [Chitinophagaceae bacterium]
MKTFLARCIFFLLLFSGANSSAQTSITGSDTVCAGYMYGYKVVMPGAVTFTWTLPAGWYFLYGQGTDSVYVNCNVNIGYITVVGFDTAGIPVASDSVQVTWGSGGDIWHLWGTQHYIPPCYCYSYWTFEI